MAEQQDRRVTVDRRRNHHQDTHDTPCVDLVMLDNRLSQLAQDLHDYKKEMDKCITEAEDDRTDILAELKTISDILSRQRGFIAGVVWLAGGLVAVAAAAFEVFKH